LGATAKDIAFGENGGRHALAPILNKFKRRFGEIQVDLSQADGRAFLQAIFDSQPNLFDQDFRETLYRYTAGNPLFTIELLEAASVQGRFSSPGCWRAIDDVIAERPSTNGVIRKRPRMHE